MTKPTLTLKHGRLDDFDSTTGWTPTYNNMDPGQCVLTCVDNDILQIAATPNDANDESVYYEKAMADFGTNYDKFLLHYKTSNASNAMGARVQLVYSSGSDWLLGQTTPAFSTDWTTVTGTIAHGSAVTAIRLYADDYPNNVASGTQYVYYDFVLFHQYTITFPFISDTLEFNMRNRYAGLQIPGRVWNVSQYLGMDSPTITLRGEMDTNANWGTPPGEPLQRLIHEAFNDPFQWFTSDVINCKVVPLELRITQDARAGATRMWELDLELYSKSSGSQTLWSDMQWLGI